jgi:hypothetical protein
MEDGNRRGQIRWVKKEQGACNMVSHRMYRGKNHEAEA